MLFKSLLKVKQCNGILWKSYTNSINSESKFETVFSFPFVKYIALFNRLKVYHMIGTSIALPSSALLEFLNVMPPDTFIMSSYVGLTATAALCIGSLPFRNIIGYIYISEDNSLIKISSVDFWGKRKNRTISYEDWIPLSDLAPKSTDVIYLTPCLADGTKYKFCVKFGNILDSHKLGQVLE